MSSESIQLRASWDRTTPSSQQRQKDTDHAAKRPKVEEACQECKSRKLDDRVRVLGNPDVNTASTANEPVRPYDHSKQWNATMQRQSRPSAGATSPNRITSSGGVQRSSPNADIEYGPQQDTSQLTHPAVEAVDAMGNFGTTGSSYGPSSSCAASFVKTINDAVTARLSSTRKQQSVVSWEELKVLQPGQSAAEIFMLPPRKAADEMMEVYWHRFHVLFPFLCRPRFTSVYQSLWTGEYESINESSTYCLLNSIFAICCRFTKKNVGDEKDSAAEHFSRRAIQLLQVNVIGSGCEELVQSLLHMAFYLQSTDSPNTCWVVTGLAIRIAQGLGLHLPRTSSNLGHQQDREMTRRLWHGLVSMTLGRPPTITKTNALSIPLPASIDDEYLSMIHGSDGTQPPEKPSKTEFYVQFLKLYVLQEETLSVMYSDEATEPSLTPSERIERLGFDNVLKIDSSLQKWNDSLPPHLRVPNGSDGGSTVPAFSKQANTLHLHYKYIRGDIPPSDLIDAWNKSLDILHRLRHVSASASRCLTVLKALDQAIVSEDGNSLVTHHEAENVRNGEQYPMPIVNPSTPLNQPSPDEMAATNAEMLPMQTDQSFPDSSLPEIQDFGWFDSLLGDWSGIDTSEFFNESQANLN
ncbi:MAG: hypothetical protein Q9191_002410 [Dirinaria sp. TL-2023a]